MPTTTNFLATLFLFLCLAGCNSKKPEDPIAALDNSAPADPTATLPQNVPSYDELLGSALAQKMKDGGPWSFDDLEPMSTALAKLKKLRDTFTAAGNAELAAAAKQRHSELSATYITLRQVALTARPLRSSGGEPASADTSSGE